MKIKLYDTVKTILEDRPRARDSDKELIWTFWSYTGRLTFTGLSWENFEKAATPESITRARRKVQENHPHLRATKVVEEERARIADKYKGMQPYNQDKQGKLL